MPDKPPNTHIKPKDFVPFLTEMVNAFAIIDTPHAEDRQLMLTACTSLSRHCGMLQQSGRGLDFSYVESLINGMEAISREQKNANPEAFARRMETIGIIENRIRTLYKKYAAADALKQKGGRSR